MPRRTLDDYLREAEAKYGLAPIGYRALYRAQGGRCFGCRVADGTSRRLGVDHNHLTGEVRALVCTGSLSAQTCNRAIARFNQAQLLRLAAILGDPPPARAVLAAIAQGLEIPSLVGGSSFRIEDL